MCSSKRPLPHLPSGVFQHQHVCVGKGSRQGCQSRMADVRIERHQPGMRHVMIRTLGNDVLITYPNSGLTCLHYRVSVLPALVCSNAQQRRKSKVELSLCRSCWEEKARFFSEQYIHGHNCVDDLVLTTGQDVTDKSNSSSLFTRPNLACFLFVTPIRTRPMRRACQLGD